MSTPADVSNVQGGVTHTKKRSAKRSAKRSYSKKRSASPKRKSVSAKAKRSRRKSRAMRGGVIDNGAMHSSAMEGGSKDILGNPNVGSLPRRKYFAQTGLSRNSDFDAVEKVESNPLYRGTLTQYDALVKLRAQLKKTRMNKDHAKKVLDSVIAYDETLATSEDVPEWLQNYAAAVEQRAKEVEESMKTSNKSLTLSLEWEVLVEEKKLAQMLLSYFSGVPVGSNMAAKQWRSDRAAEVENQKPYEQLLGAVTPAEGETNTEVENGGSVGNAAPPVTAAEPAGTEAEAKAKAQAEAAGTEDEARPPAAPTAPQASSVLGTVYNTLIGNVTSPEQV